MMNKVRLFRIGDGKCFKYRNAIFRKIVSVSYYKYVNINSGRLYSEEHFPLGGNTHIAPVKIKIVEVTNG